MRVGGGMILLLMALGPTAPVDEVPLVTGAPPLLVRIGAFDQDQGVVALWLVKPIKVPFRVRVKENVGGKLEEVEREGYKETTEVSYPKFKMADLRIYDGTGMRLRHQEVWPRLKRGAIALLSTDFEPIAPAYLTIVKKETLIFVPPR